VSTTYQEIQMKKMIFAVSILLLLFAASNVFAQATAGITGKGIKLGLNMANLTGSDVQNTKIKMGLAAGGFITYSINDLFAIQPEVLYMMKGAKSDVTVNGVTSTQSLKLNYIEIPILVKVLLSGGGNFKPNFYAGPAIGILMSAKAEDLDVKSNYKSSNIGLVGGVGADYLMGTGTGKITFDLRYTVGLGTIAKTQTIPLVGEVKPKVKTADITFLVGYGF
jgi:hypothetical protein